MLKKISHNAWFPLAIGLGVICGWIHREWIFQLADTLSLLFLNLLKLVSLPIVFLSIISTASGMENLQAVKELGQKVVKYTLLTTLLAASVALFFFIVVDPVGVIQSGQMQSAFSQETSPSYLSFLVQIVPSNIILPFSENHVIAVLFLAILLSAASFTRP